MLGLHTKERICPRKSGLESIKTIVVRIALSGASLFQCGLEVYFKGSNILSGMLWLAGGFATHSLTVRILSVERSEPLPPHPQRNLFSKAF